MLAGLADHLLAILLGGGHGLFAQHVHAHAGGPHGVFLVEVVGQGDVHRIHLAAGQALLVLIVGVGLLHAVFPGQRLQLRRIVGDERGDPAVPGVGEGGQHRDLGEIAQPDHGVADLLAFLLLARPSTPSTASTPSRARPAFLAGRFRGVGFFAGMIPPESCARRGLSSETTLFRRTVQAGGYSPLQSENAGFTSGPYTVHEDSSQEREGDRPIPCVHETPGHLEENPMIIRRLFRFTPALLAVTAGALLMAGCHRHHCAAGTLRRRRRPARWPAASPRSWTSPPIRRPGWTPSRTTSCRARPTSSSLREGFREELLGQVRAGSVDTATLNGNLEKREEKARELRAFLVAKFAEFQGMLDASQREKLASRIEKHWRDCH